MKKLLLTLITTLTIASTFAVTIRPLIWTTQTDTTLRVSYVATIFDIPNSSSFLEFRIYPANIPDPNYYYIGTDIATATTHSVPVPMQWCDVTQINQCKGIANYSLLPSMLGQVVTN